MRHIVGAVVAVAVLAAGAWASGTEHPARAESLKVRGKYVVERVAMCQDCHSPRGEDGVFLEERWLGGAPLGFSPVAPMTWSEVAPPIAGLPTMSEDQAVSFLMNGVKPDGTHARPPMPEYRLNRQDAQAVVVFLKSLSPAE